MRCYFCHQPVQIEREAFSNACARCSEAQCAPRLTALREAEREKLIVRGLARAARARAHDAFWGMAPITGWENFGSPAWRQP